MQTKNVVITGVSAVSTLGVGYDALANGLGTPNATTTWQEDGFHTFDKDVPCFRIPGYEPKEVLGKKGMRTKDWSTKVLMGAIELGFKETLETLTGKDGPGLCVGTAFGSVQSIGDFLSDSIENGVNAVNPMLFGNTVINAPTGNANIRYGIQSLSTTVATGFNASLDALIYSTDHISCGYLPAILTGGVEEVSYYTLVGLMRSGALSATGSMRPFAADGDGYLMGEGSAMLMLEEAEAAKARGAVAIAEIVGTAATFDRGADGGYNPEAEGAIAAVKQACDAAGISPADVGLVAANANGLRAADAMEARVIRELFPQTPVAAYKAQLGECYGASGALVTACTLADLAKGTVSATATDYAQLDGINLAASGTAIAHEYAAINSFSCDGNCGCIIIKNVQ